MKTTKLIALFLFAGMLVASCGNNAQNHIEEQANNEAAIQAEAQQRAEEARIEAEKRAEEERIAEERRQEELLKQKEEQTLNWMQGTWEYHGRLQVYGNQYMDVSYKLIINGRSIVSYGNGKVVDRGSITDIDMDEQRISFGSQSYFEYDNGSHIIYTGSRDEGTRYYKVSD